MRTIPLVLLLPCLLVVPSGCGRGDGALAPSELAPAPSSTDQGAPPAPGTTRAQAGPASTLSPPHERPLPDTGPQEPAIPPK